MSFSTPYFLTRKKKKMAQHFPCVRGGTTCSSGAVGSLFPPALQGLTRTSAPLVCCHVDVFLVSALTDNFWRKSSWKSWLGRTFNVSYFAWVAAETDVFKESQQRLLSTTFCSFRRRPSSSPEYEKPPSSSQCSQRAASYRHLEYIHTEFFLVQTNL